MQEVTQEAQCEHPERDEDEGFRSQTENDEDSDGSSDDDDSASSSDDDDSGSSSEDEGNLHMSPATLEGSCSQDEDEEGIEGLDDGGADTSETCGVNEKHGRAEVRQVLT